MLPTISATGALALLTLIVAAPVHAASRIPDAVVNKPIAKDLGVPSKPQTPPLRIFYGHTAFVAKKLATIPVLQKASATVGRD
jgi:hypothetical protein